MTEQLPEWADPAVPERDLDRQGLSRRTMLRRTGLFGAGFAATLRTTYGPGGTRRPES